MSEVCLSSNTRVDGATCLGDVLGACGHRTVFMTGVDIRFGGVETFHAAHGLVERLGFEALSPLAGIDTGRLPNRHWLIEDEMLFALARAKVHELAEEAEPFALAMNTADTHGSGFPSASCEGTDGMLAAVRCADRLVAAFVRDVRAAHPDVVVALLTDHLAGTSFADSELMAVLARTDERRLRFTAWAPDAAPETIARPGTHFDVMPTLMDFLKPERLDGTLPRRCSRWGVRSFTSWRRKRSCMTDRRLADHVDSATG